MPIDYHRYPANWKTVIRPAIMKRAGNRCEFCGVENGATGYRDKQGVFHRLDGMELEVAALERTKTTTIVLTVAHLNHDVTDNRPENLKALCQKCHLTLDAEQHRQTRHNNKLRNCPDLFQAEENKS